MPKTKETLKYAKILKNMLIKTLIFLCDTNINLTIYTIGQLKKNMQNNKHRKSIY